MIIRAVMCLLLGLAVLAGAPAPAQDRVDYVLGQTYGTGGETTGWIPPTTLMSTLDAIPGVWNGQTLDCTLNTCLNFPLSPAYTFPGIGIPNTRTLALATAYQATTITKAAVITLNLTSNAGLTLGGGTTNTAAIIIGATNAVASGTGTTVGTYSNALTGTLVVGVAINAVATQPITFVLPAGWFFAIRQTSGTVTISSAFDQSVG